MFVDKTYFQYVWQEKFKEDCLKLPFMQEIVCDSPEVHDVLLIGILEGMLLWSMYKRWEHLGDLQKANIGRIWGKTVSHLFGLGFLCNIASYLLISIALIGKKILASISAHSTDSIFLNSNQWRGGWTCWRSTYKLDGSWQEFFIVHNSFVIQQLGNADKLVYILVFIRQSLPAVG